MNLESRLLDGKPCGYCSSSDEEEDDFKVVKDEDEHQANVMKQFGPSSNTGAKGVLNDFKQFREQAKQAIERKNLMFIEQAKRGMMMGSREEREKAQKNAELEDEMRIDDIRAKRLRELRKVAANRLIEITTRDQYSDAVDGSTSYLLAVLIYEPENEDCAKLSYLCKILAADYPKTKFIRATSTLLGMSSSFKENGVPALQFYLNGNLIGNFIKITSVIGNDVDVEKLQTFIKRNHIDMVNGGFLSDSEDDDECD
ncbi:unnamed protein product [Caenorhabditis bovis]|uniref:Phosducin domain-containing protein n=1 Tax=Caenorhabditis bovis TaxID=2654633 RepID=A0A8S1ESR5_9PELO|nr:unnamed protein product [Caenorhabditis bovis]